ncbi:cell division protein FtsZ [Methanocella sp. CWC-04]|uniref:Cell division protein FtsZ n=1 Tax=Methanooceanicella nereidis TaxID=2052831 RepID=A0AAP2RFN4_9EURY|nr:cell division protein FtsZ [Methanocella sp. CWC-04]MCD1295715.1 cell division protein FtsZ [Methanocella sp. CWC-04]
MLEQENIPEAELYDYFPKMIKVVGCGGAGNNIINYINSIGLFGADTYAVDTDKRHLDVIRAGKKFHIGSSLEAPEKRTPEFGKKAAEVSGYRLHEAFQGSKVVFLIAGMGGVTGTGSAPVVARLAREYGAHVIALVTLPFKEEKEKRELAEEGINEVLKNADTVVVMDYEKLPGYDPGIPKENAYFMMDELLAEKIRLMVEIVTKRSLSHIAIWDYKRFFERTGLGVMFLREYPMDGDLIGSLETALEFPMSEHDASGATKAYVVMTSTRNISFDESVKLMDGIKKVLPSGIDIIWGAEIKKDFEKKLGLLIILTGFKK